MDEMLGLGESLLEVLCEKLGERFRSSVKLGELKVGCDIGIGVRGCIRGWVSGLVIQTCFKFTSGKLPAGFKRALICHSFRVLTKALLQTPTAFL